MIERLLHTNAVSSIWGIVMRKHMLILRLQRFAGPRWWLLKWDSPVKLFSRLLMMTASGQYINGVKSEIFIFATTQLELAGVSFQFEQCKAIVHDVVDIRDPKKKRKKLSQKVIN